MNRIVLAFALLAGCLYSCMLPLWEGFDEPFHYGYVQSLARWLRVPVQRESVLSDEVNASLSLTPQDRVFVESADHRISLERQRERYYKLQELSPARALTPSTTDNYESQQAPLAYLLLAPADRLLSGLRLSGRVLWLRFLGCGLSVLLTLYFLNLLSDATNLKAPFRYAAFACVFQSEMFWATTAHICNDWLAVPLTVGVLAYLARAAASEAPPEIYKFNLLVGLGLLTKAYFLCFVPIAILLGIYLIARRPNERVKFAWSLVSVFLIAGPWYLRNLVLYRSLSGTQESTSGVTVTQTLAAALQVNWLKSALSFFRWSLWTGNWSFLSYSAGTLNLELAVIAAIAVVYLKRADLMQRAEIWMLICFASFAAGLAYQTCATYINTNGQSTQPEPWYSQGVIPGLWLLGFLGLQRATWIGRGLATVIVLLTGWIAAVTYVAKLMPFYGGLHSRSTLLNVMHWWQDKPAEHLQYSVLAPVYLTLALLCLYYVGILFLLFVITRSIWRRELRVSPIAI